MKYIALLCGINVGGNSMIKMVDLKKSFEDNGYANVSTYINSGNVIFDSSQTSGDNFEQKIEKFLSQTFFNNLQVIVISGKQFQEVLENIPGEWKTSPQDYRCYIAFVKNNVSPNDVAKEINLKEGVDSLKLEQHVLYMTTKLSGITQSSFSKLTSKNVYQSITIRNLNTCQKLLALVRA